MSLLKDFKTNYVLVKIQNSKLSKKEKLVKEIKREINLIKNRENLELKKITKKIKGLDVFVNENRFWKKGDDDNYVLVTLKYKGIIVGLENKKEFFKIDNDKNKLVEFLNSIIEYLIKIEENDVIWNDIKIK
jgi:hypothetical protein